MKEGIIRPFYNYDSSAGSVRREVPYQQDLSALRHTVTITKFFAMARVKRLSCSVTSVSPQINLTKLAKRTIGRQNLTA